MGCHYYNNQNLYIEDVSVQKIASIYGTPCYVYSKAQLERNWQSFADAFKTIRHRICYAVKANSNIALLNLLASLNAGFDIVSMGELKRVIAAKGDVNRVIFSGVGKTEKEIEFAIDQAIYCFDVESIAEIKRIHAIAAKKNKQVHVALRVNPNVVAETHAHITTGSKENKFGIDFDDVLTLCQDLKNYPTLQLVGIACHIGSQLTELAPFLEALDRMLLLYRELIAKDFAIRHLNMGGGLGITYNQENPPSVKAYADALISKIKNLPIELIIEPGRSIVGNAGILITEVQYLKHHQHKNFAIVDAGMNDLLRPALYDAWQAILPVTKRNEAEIIYDIGGPVCESADFLGKDRKLALQAGDLLAIDGAGAYGFSMSSNYNSRPRPAEVLVAGDKVHLIRQRETIDDLFSQEQLIVN